MRTTRFATLVVLVLPICALSAQSVSIHNVALLDWDSILTAFYAETAEIREYRRMEAATKDDLAAFDRQIRETEQARSEALARGDTKRAAELLDRLVLLENERPVLAAVRRRAQQDAIARLTRQNTYRTIVQVVEAVAWENGFSHVRRIDDDDIWWSQEIDIPQKVIQALLARGGQR